MAIPDTQITPDQALRAFEMVFDNTPGTRDSFYNEAAWIQMLEAARQGTL